MTRSARLRRIVCALLATAACGGCYTHDSLVERVRNRAIRLRIEEVQLGQFSVTLPRNEHTAEMAEVSMRVYGLSPRYKINEIEDEIELKNYLMHDLAIRTLRGIEHSDLTEPDLDRLRGKLLTAFNGVIEGSPLVGLGFYEVRFTRH